MDDRYPNFRFHSCPICKSEDVEMKASYVGVEIGDDGDDIFATFWVECNVCGFKSEQYSEDDSKRPWSYAYDCWEKNAPVMAKAVEWYRKLKKEEDNTAK